MVLQNELEKLYVEYYEDYYRNQLGLPDWEVRVRNRINEVESTYKVLIEKIESWMNLKFKEKDRILIVGGGTGGEFFTLNLKGCEVHAIEPDEKAAKIAQLKAKQIGIDGNYRFMRAVGEFLPYIENYFDYVLSFTVLEHTQDEEQCIKEMVRVIKSRGRIFLCMPDYRQFYEGHYKINFPFPLFFLSH